MPKRFVRSMFAAAVLAAVSGYSSAQQSPVAQPVAPPVPVPCVSVSEVPGVGFKQAVAVAQMPIPSPAQHDLAKQVQVECVILSVPPTVWAKTAAEIRREGQSPFEAVVVEEIRANKLLMGMKSGGGMDVVANPQLVLGDNQTGFFQSPLTPCTTGTCPAVTPTGMTFRATPRIESDGRNLLMRIEYQHVVPCPAVKNPTGAPVVCAAPTSSCGETTVSMPSGAVAFCEGPVVTKPGCDEKAQHVLVVKARVAKPTAPSATSTHEIKRFGVGGLVVPFVMAQHDMRPLGTLRQVTPPLPLAAVPTMTPRFAVAQSSEVQRVSFDYAVPPPVPAVDMVKNGEALCRLVQNSVHPYSWVGAGGTGVIVFRPQTKELTVAQTPAVMAEVSAYIEALQKLQEKRMGSQVAFECRVVEYVPFERVGVDFNTESSPCEAAAAWKKVAEVWQKPNATAGLTEAQVAALLETCQANPGGNVLMAPKMTCFDGQRGIFQTSQSHVFQTGLELTAAPSGVVRKPKFEIAELGMRLSARPTVSADKRFVKVEMEYESATLNPSAAVVPVAAGDGRPPEDFLCQPVVDKQMTAVTFAVPVGGTVAIAGPILTREVRVERGVPVLSGVPYINRLFKNVGTSQVQVRQLILVTPRLIPTEEPEVKLTAGCASATQPTGVTTSFAVKSCGDCCKGVNPKAAELVAAYRKACKEGRSDAAAALAIQALALDPACFAGK